MRIDNKILITFLTTILVGMMIIVGFSCKMQVLTYFINNQLGNNILAGTLLMIELF